MPSPTVISVGEATSFLLEPVEPGLAPEVVTGTAALFTLRLVGTGGVVEVAGDGVRVTFPEPPPPEVMARLVDPTVVELRPVLVAGAPDLVDEDGGDDLAIGQPLSPSDADYYLTGAMFTALYDMDCTNPGTAPFASPEGAMVACDAAGSAKYALGPVEVTGDMLAEVEAGPRTLPGGGVTDEVVVTMMLDADGTSAFREATTRLASLFPPADQFAIVVDGQVVSAPAVQEVIPSGELVLSGSGEDDTFTTLVAQLLYGRDGSTWEVVSADT